MKVAIAIDSFKGSIGSVEAGNAAAEGVRRAVPGAECVVRPLADGGEGTVDALVAGLAAKGMAAVIVSSDMTELIGLCSRIAVMRAGRIAGEVSGDAKTEKSIIRIATGTEGDASE